MTEMYIKWRNQLYGYLKDKVRGVLTCEVNEDTNSLYLCVTKDGDKFERGIFGLDGKVLTQGFNVKKEGDWFLRQYEAYIKSKYMR